jgi:hypothetical protein
VSVAVALDVSVPLSEHGGLLEPVVVATTVIAFGAVDVMTTPLALVGSAPPFSVPPLVHDHVPTHDAAEYAPLEPPSPCGEGADASASAGPPPVPPPGVPAPLAPPEPLPLAGALAPLVAHVAGAVVGPPSLHAASPIAHIHAHPIFMGPPPRVRCETSP